MSMNSSKLRGVLTERNAAAQRLSSITASCRRRHEALLVKQRQEKMRRRRMVRRLEYQRLRTIVPSLATRPIVSEVTVIVEAIRYIDYLHKALLKRLRTKGLPSCLADVAVDVKRLTVDDLKELVSLVMKRTKPQGPCPAPYLERSRVQPSYLRGRRPPHAKRT